MLFASAILVSFAACAAMATPLLSERADAVKSHWKLGEIGEGDFVVHTKDGSKKMNTTEYHDFLDAEGILRSPPPINPYYTYFNASHLADSGIKKRWDNCDDGTITWVIDEKQRFVDWDLQMSPVVIGNGPDPISVTVSSSYTATNSISGSGEVDISVITDAVGASLGVSLTKSWSTTHTVSVYASVREGYTGVVINTPWVNRAYGRIFKGCPGNTVQTGVFMTSTYEEGSYDDVPFINGAVTSCLKQQSSIPLSRCHGDGNFQ